LALAAVVIYLELSRALIRCNWAASTPFGRRFAIDSSLAYWHGLLCGLLHVLPHVPPQVLLN
jgi:hypothetical protein